MIDSHAHVTDEAFTTDRQVVVERAHTAGVSWIEIGTSLSTSQRALALADEYSNAVVGATIGVHPSAIGSGVDWSAIDALLNNQRVCAVGEVGLDYYRGGTKEAQLPTLQRFIQIATVRSLPVVFHVRSSEHVDAHVDMLDYLQALPKHQRPRGVMHTFSGTWEQARQYLALGLYISLSGVVTFKNAPDMHEVAQKTPFDRLLIETDCPYLTPEPHRGQRNEPAHVALVARKIAELRGISFEDVALATEQNTLLLFKLKT